MIVTAWNNGAHSRNGTGYGFRIHSADRDEFFQKEWLEILVDVDGEAEPAKVTIPVEAFWSENGKELICPAVGRWLRRNGMAPWGKGNPPVIVLDAVEGNHFRILKARKSGKPT
jgi:hypothetical protein